MGHCLMQDGTALSFVSASGPSISCLKCEGLKNDCATLMAAWSAIIKAGDSEDISISVFGCMARICSDYKYKHGNMKEV